MSRTGTEEQIAAIFADSGADLRELKRLRSRIKQVHDDVQDAEEPDFLARQPARPSNSFTFWWTRAC